MEHDWKPDNPSILDDRFEYHKCSRCGLSRAIGVGDSLDVLGEVFYSDDDWDKADFYAGPGDPEPKCSEIIMRKALQ